MVLQAFRLKESEVGLSTAHNNAERLKDLRIHHAKWRGNNLLSLNELKPIVGQAADPTTCVGGVPELTELTTPPSQKRYFLETEAEIDRAVKCGMLKHAGSYYWNYVQRADSKQLNEDLFKHGDQVRLHRAPDLTGLHQVSMSSVRTGTQVELWHKFGDTVAEAKWQGENVAFQSIDDADLSSRAKAIKRLFKTKSGAADLLPNRLIRGFADETAMRTEFATESAIVAERLGTRPAPAQQGPPTEIALGGHKIRLWRHTEDGEAHPVQRLLFASKAALEADNVLPANYAKFEAGVPVDITLVVTNPTHAKASITNWGDLAAWHVGASDAYTAETIFCFDRVAGLAPETAPLAAATCKCFRNERPLTVDDVLQHVDDQDKEGALWYTRRT